MWKQCLFSWLVVSATVLAAEKTTIEFPFYGEVVVNHTFKKISATQLNAKLKSEGLDGIPAKIVVGTGAKQYWRVIMKRIEAGNEVITPKVSTPLNSGYFYEFPKMCYRGDIKQVPSVLHSMLGNFLNEEQGVLALRYGNKKLIQADQFKSYEALEKHYEGDNKKEIKAWVNFDEESEEGDVLVMSDLGPQGDGTELYATVIKPCAD